VCLPLFNIYDTLAGMLKDTELRLLRCFADQDARHFVELCKATGLDTDLGGYYLRSLVRQGILIRPNYGEYVVTVEGKRLLALLKNHQALLFRPRLCVLIVAQQKDKYIVLERSKQPYIGVHEWPAGSLQYGEQAEQAVSRVCIERFGATGTPAYSGNFRRIDKHNGTVFDDKAFMVYTLAFDDNSQILPKNAWGTNKFYTRDELAELALPSKSLIDILEMTSSRDLWHEERLYELTGKDFYLERAIDDDMK
jgi:ADP-ribose pyrophosphatase YjhB (NUDIX family)/predicted transcriptional regulator